jgi:hypothetical protein
VIGKVSPRGCRVEPLIRYLYGPGRASEHTDPHIVAGWWTLAELEPLLQADGRRDFRRLSGLLRQPHDALGEAGHARPVWHCSVRAAPGDRTLPDEQWAQVARDVMHRTGLAPHGQDDDAVRWVAVRHAADHVHIVAMLARQDGARPWPANDFYRVGEACRAAEERYGLTATAPRDRTAARRPARAETEKAARRGLAEAPRVTLRRHAATAAAAAGSEAEFFGCLGRAGVEVRRRHSQTDPGQVTGYAVGLPGDTGQDGGQVWYGGGKLAPDLTLPKLRARWDPARAPGARPGARDPGAAWEQAARAADGATAFIGRMAGAAPDAAADAAWATADLLRAAASAAGTDILRQCADAYDRAARQPFGRLPAPTPTGNSLRAAARVLSAAAYATRSRPLSWMAFILRLAALAEAAAGLRRAQQRAAQSAAALAAARQLHAAASAAQRSRRDRPLSPAQLAGTGFAAPSGLLQRWLPAPPRPRPSRRPRGPGP